MSIKNITFNTEELIKYSRHIAIPEFGREGQQKLKAASVLVVGSGGLGSPLLLYLAAAGIGTIGIIDFDVVDKSNLQRQILFNHHDLGKAKVEAAKQHLTALNPYISIRIYNDHLTSQNALELIKDYDIVADGTDNFPTRYLVNDACVLSGKPNVYASIFRFDGQVSVFNYTDKHGMVGPNYRCLYPEPPPPGLVPSCAEGGVLGVLPGIIGSLQANEVIKIITGIGEPLSGRLFIFDALKFETRILRFKHDENNPLNGKNPTITKLIDYQQFCGINSEPIKELTMKEITVYELKEWQDQKKEFQLIDVREAHEYEIANLGGDLLPLSEIVDHTDQIKQDVDVIFYCRSGVRSQKVIHLLSSQMPIERFYSLQGGIEAYAEKIDPSLL